MSRCVEGLQAAVQRLLDLLDRIVELGFFSLDRIFLLGYSQVGVGDERVASWQQLSLDLFTDHNKIFHFFTRCDALVCIMCCNST